jgi:hypothetical protein
MPHASGSEEATAIQPLTPLPQAEGRVSGISLGCTDSAAKRFKPRIPDQLSRIEPALLLE